MQTNTDINGGLLLSLKTGICARDDFCFEFIDKKPIVFCHNVAKNMSSIKVAINIIKLFLKPECVKIKEDKQLQDKLKIIISSMKKMFKKQRSRRKKELENATAECDETRGIISNNGKGYTRN